MVKIAKIRLEIGKKVIEMSLEEAKELRDALNGLMEEKTVYTSWYWYDRPRSYSSTGGVGDTLTFTTTGT